MNRVPLVLGAALVLFALASPSQAADHSDLLRFIPDSANAIMVIDVGALMKSERGRKEGWIQKHHADFLGGALPVSPRLERALFATQLGASDPKDAAVVGVVPIPKGASLEALAKKEKGEIETIAGQDVMASPRGAYFTEVAPGIGGVVAPGSRQLVARWLKFAKKNKDPVVSDYLKDAAKFPRDGQILLAVDAEDLFHPRAIKNWLAHTQKQLSKEDAEVAHKMLTSMRGIKFMARVTDTIKGQLYLDFAEKPDARQLALLKPIVIAGLNELGASVDDFKDGKSTVEGRSVIVEAELNDNALRRIMSIIQAPVPSVGIGDEKDPDTAANPELVATQRYFKSVQSLITELKDMNNKAYHSGMVIHWYETYSKKIDQLPLLDVDPEMLQYGKVTAGKLRELGKSLNGQNIQVNLLESYKRTNIAAWGPSYGGSYYTGYWGQSGGAWAQTNAGDVQTAKHEAVAKSRNDRFSVWQSIDEDTAEVRRSMTEKYRTEFKVGG